MNAPTFRIPDPQADCAALLALNVEYVTWVFAEIEKMSGIAASAILGAEVADYVPTVMDKVCGDPPPRGVFYLVEEAGQLLAMGGLRHSEAGIAELKRVYVRPAGRGKGLGAALARRLVADARRFGYTAVRLDTLPFMHAAQRVYAAMGFIDCPPYPIEMPPAFRGGIRYMQLALRESAAAAPQYGNIRSHAAQARHRCAAARHLRRQPRGRALQRAGRGHRARRSRGGDLGLGCTA